MARMLQRLGLSVARHRIAVIIAWLLVLAGVGVAAVTLSGPTANSFSIPSAESSQALTTVEQKFPATAAQGATATVVMVAPDGTTVKDPQVAAEIGRTVAALGAAPEVESASNPLDPQQPIVSKDGRIVFSRVTFAQTQGNVSDESLAAVQQAVEAARSAGFEVKVGGNAFQQVPEVAGPAEIGGVVIAFLVLLLTYGSLAAAGANLLTALIGVGIGAAGITALTGVIDLQSTTPILAIMLGLAVGIDYALFIFARFRSELRDGRGVEEAIGRATGTAGSAVVVAGLTVVIALAGLSVVGIPFLAEMGLAAAATVVIAVLVALTLVPALLTTMGARVLRKSERRAAEAAAVDPGAGAAPVDSAHGTTVGNAVEKTGRTGFLQRWANLLTGRAGLAAVGGVVLLGVLAAPVLSMQTALPNDGTADPASQQRQAYDLISENFGAGLSAPLLILVEGDNGPAQAAAVAQQVQTTPGVALVTAPQASADGSVALFTAIPTTGPTDDATANLVNTLRDKNFGAGVEVRVTGTTAVGIDVDETLASALPLYLVVVVGLALLLLLLVFRSILVPVTATIGFLLSYGAALGVTTAVFQWGWLGDVFGVTQPAPLMSLLPIIVVGILFGLSMDYQVFLVSRIHEAYAHGDDPVAAIRHGFRRSAPVVIAAATIMAAVFGGFVGSGDSMIKSIALALTVGVLADAFLVRMIVIPAVLTLLGKGAWWMPKWLHRVLPHVDVEGAAIEKQDKAQRAVAAR
ncbi:MMPL family transporter [Nakamurella lactea]|uniref:MMPL family transporter n=1 Tax=Nakamurella lactea TaxID=459515 RepID=UPI0004284938|nr:MMPL family transporter [Nakamurella lactea]